MTCNVICSLCSEKKKTVIGLVFNVLCLGNGEEKKDLCNGVGRHVCFSS